MCKFYQPFSNTAAYGRCFRGRLEDFFLPYMNSVLWRSTSVSIDALLFWKILSKFPKQWHGSLSDWSDWCYLQTSVVFGDFRTARNKIIVEKPILDQLAKKLFAFYGIRRFIALSDRPRRCIPSILLTFTLWFPSETTRSGVSD